MNGTKFQSIGFRTGLNSFIGFAFVTVLLVSLFLWSISREFKRYIVNENELRVLSIIKMLDQNLLDYQKELQLQSESPTLVNGVMNPANSKYYIPDYLDRLRIRNLDADFTLLTFDGIVIHSSSGIYEEGRANPVLMELISRSEASETISILNDDADIALMGTVLYNGVIEGYLLMKANFRDIFEGNLELLNLQGFEHIYGASYNGSFLSGEKDNGTETLTRHHTLSTLPIEIHVSTPLSLIDEPVRTLLVQMVMLAAAASLIATLLVSLIAGRSMVKPLLILEEGIRNVSSGKWENLKTDNSNIREIRYLRNSFNRMQSSLRKRTTELEKSNNDLQKSNISLMKAQKQLIHSEKMASIGQLAAGVAHEINNPTGYISTNLSTMSDYLNVYNRLLDYQEQLTHALTDSEDPGVLSLLEDIRSLKEKEDFPFLREDGLLLLRESSDGARRIKEIVQGLQNFARSGTSEMSPGNINQAIEDALKLTWNQIKYKCEVEKNLGKLPDIECRPDQLTQVFVNLLINAEHAISEKGVIRIETFTRGETVVARVCDTGKGIEEKHLDKLFDPFFTTKGIGKGTGLGLSISHGIINDHGGEIWAESDPGHGSCFTIEIPLVRVTEAVTPPVKGRGTGTL